MLATLKVSSLAYKYAFYRPENNAKGGPQGTEFWRPLNAKIKSINARQERVHEKNRVICLVIMFAPGVMIIKMSKMTHFLYFLLMPAKKSVTVWRKYLRAS